MKKEIHKAEERGTAEHGWLHSKHSFSFADYYNPERTGFGKLRVLNDDFIDPGRGFGMHPHDNMEIISIVIDGELEHKDNMKNHGVIPVGDIQRMSAGTGVVHSEFNHSKKKKVHLLQIWVLPKEKNIAPSYEQKSFSIEDKKNKLQNRPWPRNPWTPAVGRARAHADGRANRRGGRDAEPARHV